MSKRFGLLFILILLSSFRPAILYSAQILIDSEKQFQYALDTMQEGDYIRAVTELERFIRFFPKDPRIPRAQYLIGLCYMKAKSYEPARTAFEAVYKRYRAEALGGNALLLIGETYYQQGFPEEAERYFKKVIESYPQASLTNAARYRLGWTLLQTERWREASTVFNGVEESSPLHPSAQDLARKSLMGEELAFKDPAVAGALAIIPGLGHVYTNRYKDALISFLINGLLIWATVEAFNESHEVLGGILGFVGLGFYSGNIYSAVSGAHKYNLKAKEDFRRGLPDRFNLNLLMTREGHMGLALRVRF
jgi:tol-pal system protein YbgF